MFESPQTNVRNFSHEGVSYGPVISLNTSFVSNFAKQFASAILATNIEDVLVSCSYNEGPRTGFLDQGDLALLSHIDPERLCESWKGNRQALSSTKGVIGTFGKKLLILPIESTNPSSDVQLCGNLTSGFILKNVRSGERLPQIKFMVVDAFGNGPATTPPPSFLVTINSPDMFFQGVMTIRITSGRGDISGIIGFKRPAYYAIKITPYISSIAESILKIHVRNCQIGEEPTLDYELCQDCGNFSYNFNVSHPRGCTQCPEGSTCEGRYIVPMDGYWHKGPCHDIVKECIAEDACKSATRHEDILDFTRDLVDCNMTNSALEEYNNLQCNEVRIQQ